MLVKYGVAVTIRTILQQYMYSVIKSDTAFSNNTQAKTNLAYYYFFKSYHKAYAFDGNMSLGFPPSRRGSQDTLF